MTASASASELLLQPVAEDGGSLGPDQLVLRQLSDDLQLETDGYDDETWEAAVAVRCRSRTRGKSKAKLDILGSKSATRRRSRKVQAFTDHMLVVKSTRQTRAAASALARPSEDSQPAENVEARRRRLRQSLHTKTAVQPGADGSAAVRTNTLWFDGLIAEDWPSCETVVGRAVEETSKTAAERDVCVVCMGPFDVDEPALRLRACPAGSHWFHGTCIMMALRAQSRCPACFHWYCCPRGTQPEGSMQVQRLNMALPGYPARTKTLEISYHFPSGVQGAQHPNPGQAYYGTSRTAFLPDCKSGRRVLFLFQKAWDCRLLFTVGRSVTTGMDNCVVWAGIHHKTSTCEGPFGYPDDTYLDRVTLELSAVGIV